jgi:hypothetical protein
MDTPFELLMLASLLGAVDVLYFHLYRFRLYEQPGSVAEESTHLARHVLYIGIVLTLLLQPPFARPLVLILFGLDLLNNGIDVLLERSSRAPLGGLPSAEYLIHILATLLSGMAISAYWWAPAQALSDTQLLRGWVTVGLGVVLFAVEATLFCRALLARARAQDLLRPGENPSVS